MTRKLVIALAPVLALVLAVSLAIAENPTTEPITHGLSPLPSNRVVPRAFLPPGSPEPDIGPSDIIYPAQRITLRFNHAKHLGKEVGATCATCHAAAYGSTTVGDTLTPSGAVCDSCHSSDHRELSRVKAGGDAPGQCAFCHVGHKPADGNVVAALEMPRANLVFDHKAHAARNIGCPQCHGAIEKLELATRDQLPRMQGCFRCHEMPDAAARGEAKSACETCHITGGARGTPIRTLFASGALLPPRWLHNAEHTPDFIERHKSVAADDSQFCATCHKDDFCADCHDGKVRPRSVHPNDYLNMHAIEARMEAPSQRCTGCHREQSFCLDCHLRAGVAESSPPNTRGGGRFHPPKPTWSDAPRKPGHHAFEAERNLNACVSCHTERDCVVCHGALGVGAGFDPHTSGFVNGCGVPFHRNPRPCFVCHEPSDAALSRCR